MPEDEARALAFFSLVLTIVALIFVNRSLQRVDPDRLRRPNPALEARARGRDRNAGATLAWPSRATLFRFGPLHADDLSLTVGAGVVILIALELLKPLLRDVFADERQPPRQCSAQCARRVPQRRDGRAAVLFAATALALRLGKFARARDL